MTRIEFLKSLRALVNYHRSCGVAHYQNSTSIRAALSNLDALIDESYQALSVEAPITKTHVAQQIPEIQDEGRRSAMTELAAEIGRCTNCPLHQNRRISTAGSGGLHPKLLLIGDWLRHTDERPVLQDEIFGAEQDQMLAKMTTAMGLEEGDIFVTNIIKCSVAGTVTPTAEQVSACAGFLRQQINALEPKLICTMGTAATQALLGTTGSLVQLRGRFHAYRIDRQKSVKLMPTFHPAYLLKNPEMKKPTWDDLQAIKRQLGAAGG
jgi:DNA polymerase